MVTTPFRDGSCGVTNTAALQPTGHVCTAKFHTKVLKITLNKVRMDAVTCARRQLCRVLGQPEKLPGLSFVKLWLNCFQHLYPVTRADHITYALDIFITKQKSLCEFLPEIITDKGKVQNLLTEGWPNSEYCRNTSFLERRQNTSLKELTWHIMCSFKNKSGFCNFLLSILFSFQQLCLFTRSE